MDVDVLNKLKEAQSKGVISSGDILIFNDLLKDAEAKIKKNQEQIYRLQGQIDQLGILKQNILSITNKYIRLQEEADSQQEEHEELTSQGTKKKASKKKTISKEKSSEHIKSTH